MQPRHIAIVVATTREVHPITRTWQPISIDGNSRIFQAYVSSTITIICSGMGAAPAAAAAETVISVTKPERVISAGFAGGLDPLLPQGKIVFPEFIIDATTREYWHCEQVPIWAEGLELSGPPSGVVSVADVVSREDKYQLRRKFAANAVDMESASVARVAARHGVPMTAIKIISDHADVDLPPAVPFLDSEGCLKKGPWLANALLHPRYWKGVSFLVQNAGSWADQLCTRIEQLAFDNVNVSNNSMKAMVGPSK